MSEGEKRRIRKINHMSRTEIKEKLRFLEANNDKLSTYRRCLEARLEALDAGTK